MLYLPTLTYTHTALHNAQECQIQIENPQTAQVPGNSLVVQSLGLCASTAGDLGSIPGWETRIPQASQHSQRKKKKKYISNLLSVLNLLNLPIFPTQLSPTLQEASQLHNDF